MIKYLTKYLLHGITIKSEEDLPTNCRDDLRRVVQALPVEIRSRIDAISVDTLHDWCFVSIRVITSTSKIEWPKRSNRSVRRE